MEGIIEAVNEGEESRVEESLKAFCEKVWLRFFAVGFDTSLVEVLFSAGTNRCGLQSQTLPMTWCT